jgi:hypothetical protein
MKNHLTTTLVSLFCFQASFIPAQSEGTWRNRAYDATYAMTSRLGVGTMRLAADGKGHALIENAIKGGMKNTMIVDSAQNTCYSIIQAPEVGKMAMKMPMSDSMNHASTSEDMKKRGATPLGAKVIAGHPCHGFRYSIEGGTHEDWIGDDIDMLVQGAFKDKDGDMTLLLQAYSPQAPAPSAFVLPSDARVMDVGSMGGFGGMGGGKVPSGFPGRM